jgi:molybdopterin-guanine dinucleotide biosynthesis protein B
MEDPRAQSALPFVVSVLGLKKSGKTTVAAGLIAALRARGYRVAALKKTHLSRLSLDPRGTDSYRLAEAGALFVAARSREETVTVHREPQPGGLKDLLALVPASMQFVVAEGTAGVAQAGVVLCLGTADRLEETLRLRGVRTAELIALSGVFAADPRAAAALRAGEAEALPPAFDVLRPGERDALCDRVLAAAEHPRPAGEPAGPLALDPAWRPYS